MDGTSKSWMLEKRLEIQPPTTLREAEFTVSAQIFVFCKQNIDSKAGNAFLALVIPCFPPP